MNHTKLHIYTTKKKKIFFSKFFCQELPRLLQKKNMDWSFYCCVIFVVIAVVAGCVDGEKAGCSKGVTVERLRMNASLVQPEEFVSPLRLFYDSAFLRPYYNETKLIFIHASKAGGTALTRLFNNPKECQKSFKPWQNKLLDNDTAILKSDAEWIEAILPRNCTFYNIEMRNLTFFLQVNHAADIFKPQLPIDRASKFKYIMLFRNPLSWVVSAINYRVHMAWCKNITMYLRSYETEGMKHCWMFPPNIHTLALGPGLDVALQRMPYLFFIGISDYFETSMCLLSYQLGIFAWMDRHPDCVGQESPQFNVGSHKHKDSIDLFDLRRLEKLLDDDRMLYIQALTMFAKRIRHVEATDSIHLVSPKDSDSLRHWIANNNI